jgi:hypothetical protein
VTGCHIIAMLCDGSLRVGAESSCFLWGASDPKRGCVLRVFFLPPRKGLG